MVYLLNIVMFHGYVSHNQMVYMYIYIYTQQSDNTKPMLNDWIWATRHSDKAISLSGSSGIVVQLPVI